MPAHPVPIAPKARPLLGHLLSLGRDPLDFLRSLPSQGDLAWVKFGPIRVLIACSAETTHELLVDDRTFDKGGAIFDRVREVTGNGLGTCPHAEHRRIRRLTQPAFHSRLLDTQARVMTGQINAAISAWRTGQTIDVMQEMLEITSRVLITTMFTDALPAAALEPTMRDSDTVLTGTFKRALMPVPLARLPFFGNRQYHLARLRLRTTVAGIIAARRSASGTHSDLLSILLERPEGNDDQLLTDEEIENQVITFLVAGTDTTASLLAWAMSLLVKHPQIAERLRQELHTTLNGEQVTLADLPALLLTRNIITETLRLYPPVWLLTRTATTDCVVGGQPTQAGTTVLYSPYLIHHHPDLYPDPEVFDPDRWSSDRRPPRNAFIPFGAGARKCIGDTFGVTEATLALATIAARWDFTLVSDASVTAAFVLRPRNLKLRLTARQPDQRASTTG
ncbi:cytochrome P450 [Kribbella sp. NPDC056861]|uniref:cytochrome P450 n=1 Tax=Kribbella sp. NPDC056861 TaxID=3154857 RepID=UPI00342E2B8D